MAIEVSIPKDIEEYKVGFVFGLTKKHLGYIAASAAFVVPSIILGRLGIIPPPITTLITITAAVAAIIPLIIDGNQKGRQPAEEVIKCFLSSTFSTPLKYEHMDYIATVDYQLATKAHEKSRQSYLRKLKNRPKRVKKRKEASHGKKESKKG